MFESLLSDGLSIIALLLLIIIAITYFILEKGSNWLNFDDGLNNIKKPEGFDNKGLSQPMKSIFYQYNHKSEREWMEWMREQNSAVRSSALKLLNDHFESPAKHWGPLTEEALGTIPIFKEEGGEHVVSNFFLRSGKLWGEVKSIPNFYKRAANVLAIMSPQIAVKCFSDEFERKSSIQVELERKTIIVDAMPKVGTLGIGLITNIIIDNLEIFAIRTHALRTAAKFESVDYQRIILEALKHQIRRFANLERELEQNEKEIVEDLFTAAAKYIADKEFTSMFQFACEAGRTMRQHAIEPLIKRIKEEKENLGVGELYAMTLLQDDKNNSLRRALAGLHGLEEDEIQSICIAKLRDDPIIEEALLKENTKLASTPIPRPYWKEFEKFTKLYEPASSIGQQICQKAYGGLLVTGNNELEKIYFARAFAESKKLNFGRINVANINNKEDYNKVCNIFTELRKPYMLYIEHPELMYPSGKSQAASYRLKFAQTLYIQALDTKSYLLGSIKQKAKDIESSTTLAAVQELRANFFAQAYEINKQENQFKSAIIEDYFMSIAPHRLSNRPELARTMMDKLKDTNHLEFCFEVLRYLATMLLVYGKSASLDEIERLRARFTIQLKGKIGNIKPNIS